MNRIASTRWAPGAPVVVALLSAWLWLPAGEASAVEEPKETPVGNANPADSVAVESVAVEGVAVDTDQVDVQAELARHIDPAEVRRGMRMGRADGKSRTQRFYEALASTIEADRIGRPENLSQYVALHKRELVNDTRVFPAEIAAEWDADREAVVLTGYVAFQENRESMLELLKYLGFDNVDDRIEALPAAALGDKKYGLLTAANAMTYMPRGEGQESMTEPLMGDHLFLLKDGENDDVLVMSSEGYIGHVKDENIRRVDAAELARYRSGARARIVRGIEVDGHFLPAGARLKVSEAAGGTIRVELPGGQHVTLPEGAAVFEDEGTPQLVENAIATAEQFLGTDYRWGGNSLDGIDCSGLIQTSFRAQGINYPRDADQQSYLGSLSATRWNRDGLRRGDTLYFLGGRSGKISHTAIYLGDNLYIEATGPIVKYTSFDPESEEYDEGRDRRFCFAKRLLH